MGSKSNVARAGASPLAEDSPGGNSHGDGSLERRLEKRLARPLSRFRDHMASTMDLVLDEQQRMQSQHRKELRRMKEETARQQQSHREHVLRLEEALLSQSVTREQEMLGQLQELEQERAALQAANARLAGTAPLTYSNAGSQMQGSLDAPVAQALSFSWSSPQLASSAPLPPQRPPAPPATRRNIMAGIPDVYQAAVTFILEHGWEALHGEAEGPSWTALHWAAAEGRTDLCEALLRAGGDAEHPDEEGRTPLDCAIEAGQRAAVSVLSGACDVGPDRASLVSASTEDLQSTPRVLGIGAHGFSSPLGTPGFSPPFGRGAPSPEEPQFV